jgi:hypothetical protein
MRFRRNGHANEESASMRPALAAPIGVRRQAAAICFD